MSARTLALALLAALPALAGCTAPPPPGDAGVHPHLAPAVLASSDAEVAIHHAYGSILLDGPALVVPVARGGGEYGAVFLGSNVSWKADAVLQLKGRDQVGDVFVQAPAGAWPGLRSDLGLRDATASDLAAHGFGDASEARRRASAAMPTNDTPPEPATWVLNGTVSARVEPTDFVFASEEGPFVFQRNATSLFVVEGKSLVTWSPANLSLAASQDALVSAQIFDASLADLSASWTNASVTIRVVTPPFRRADLEADDDRNGKLASARLPGVAEVVMARYTEPPVFRDNYVRFASANMTIEMAN